MSKLVKISENHEIYLTEDFIRSIDYFGTVNRKWYLRLKYELKIYNKKEHFTHFTSVLFKSHESRTKFSELLQKIHDDLVELPVYSYKLN